MQTLARTIKMSDLRKNTEKVVKIIQNSNEAFTLLSRSEPVMVLMSITAYRKIKDDEFSYFDPADFEKGADFFRTFAKKNSTKGMKFDAAEVIRKDRDGL